MACLHTINDSTFSQFSFLSFFGPLFSIDLEIIAFFQSDFFSARLGIALELWKEGKRRNSFRTEKLLLPYSYIPKNCAVSEPQKEYLIKKQSNIKKAKKKKVLTIKQLILQAIK